MKKFMEGTTSISFVTFVEEKFEAMCRTFTSYDFTIVRQQLFKLTEDKHLNVSLFNRDEVQRPDGQFLLDLSDHGPQHSVRPGQIKFFNPDTGEETKTKQIDIVHAPKWKPHPSTDLQNRMEVTTKPRLGENIYAADRQPLPVPWKPEVTIIPNSRSSASTPQTTPSAPTPAMAAEESKEPEDEDDEYNLLADLVGF